MRESMVVLRSQLDQEYSFVRIDEAEPFAVFLSQDGYLVATDFFVEFHRLSQM
jgi:hypothetical protein